MEGSSPRHRAARGITKMGYNLKEHDLISILLYKILTKLSKIRTIYNFKMMYLNAMGGQRLPFCGKICRRVVIALMFSESLIQEPVECFYECSCV